MELEVSLPRENTKRRQPCEQECVPAGIKGRRLEWHNTGIEHSFSNFLFVDRRYRSHNVLRRNFSLARRRRLQ